MLKLPSRNGEGLLTYAGIAPRRYSSVKLRSSFTESVANGFERMPDWICLLSPLQGFQFVQSPRPVGVHQARETSVS